MECNNYKPYFDPDYDSLMERIHPPIVVIDNEADDECTLVKVDSANKDGILLEMVQVLTDLDLVISKSYICSDGGWFMDVFHVTDQLGNKITDQGLIAYIQQALCANKRVQRLSTQTVREVRPRHVSTEHAALELTMSDNPGLLSEISAALSDLGSQLAAAAIWTHNGRAACLLYLDDRLTDTGDDLPYLRKQVEKVLDAHHKTGDRWSVRLTYPSAGGTHTERRLHQLMAADRDYEGVDNCVPREEKCGCGVGGHKKSCGATYAYIETCMEKEYSVVNIRSRDRPKLLFDTVCTLTDMQYVVFHAAISSKCSIAFQEYYIRQKDGHTLETEAERDRVTRCIVAAIERRACRGLKLEMSTRNRIGLLSDITRVLRENSLSILRAEMGTYGEKAIGTFYVKGMSEAEVSSKTIESVRKDIGGTVTVTHKATGLSSQTSSMASSRTSSSGSMVEERPKFAIGSMLWAQLERLSSNFKPIRS
uniref:ACT domain-containing protein ACR n=1 Tax=Kalanchoe fedtschenkoi TaxID=63787 RepID=A0A7N1A286_KALFE